MTDTTKKIINWFKDYEEAFNDCIEELDFCIGYLEYDRCYSMEYFDDFMTGVEKIEVVKMAFFGRDEDSEYHSPFNPMRKYFKRNEDGNLISSDHKDYSKFLDERFVLKLAKYRNILPCIDQFDDLSELLNELETEISFK